MDNTVQQTSFEISNTQRYWNGIFGGNLRSLEEGKKIEVSYFRNLAREEYNISDEEFNNILFNAIYNVAEVDFDGTGIIDEDVRGMLAMYFILDNSAKEYLDAKGVISPASEAVSEIRASVENLLSTKTIENIGDLYYNTLALFLQQLGNKLNSAEIQEASTHIQIAWNLSESKIDKNNPPRRHENAENEIKKLGGIDVLAEQIGNLEPEKLKQFLSNLSQKIRTDGEKDKERGREGLSFQLLSASENLDSAKENY